MACLVTILAGFSDVLGTQTAARGMKLVSQGYVATYTVYRIAQLRYSGCVAASVCDTAVLSQMAGLNLEQQTRMARYAWLANNCRDIG